MIELPCRHMESFCVPPSFNVDFHQMVDVLLSHGVSHMYIEVVQTLSSMYVISSYSSYEGI